MFPGGSPGITEEHLCTLSVGLSMAVSIQKNYYPVIKNTVTCRSQNHVGSYPYRVLTYL